MWCDCCQVPCCRVTYAYGKDLCPDCLKLYDNANKQPQKAPPIMSSVGADSVEEK